MVKVWYRRNYVPLHQVTHRAIGDIPGCTPAPRNSTFVAVSLEQAQAETLARAEHYCAALQAYVDGEYGGQEGLKEMWHQASRAPVLRGAYGEVL